MQVQRPLHMCTHEPITHLHTQPHTNPTHITDVHRGHMNTMHASTTACTHTHSMCMNTSHVHQHTTHIHNNNTPHTCTHISDTHTRAHIHHSAYITHTPHTCTATYHCTHTCLPSPRMHTHTEWPSPGRLLAASRRDLEGSAWATRAEVPC